MTDATRYAILQVAPEMTAEVARLVLDHGLRIVGSIDADQEVGLVIAGEGLPEACEECGPIKTVLMTCTVEAYGSQRLSKISAIEVDALATEIRFQRRKAALEAIRKGE